MKLFTLILIWLGPFFASAQAKEGSSLSANDSIKPLVNRPPYKPEVLSSGFIDILNNGQINAAARFIRLLIGEPGCFAIRLSIYSGVSSNSFQNQQVLGGQRSNEHLINSFINPLSGLANISIDGVVFFNKAKTTRAGYIYHAGFRVLTGYKTGLVTDPSTGRPINFLNSYATSGLYFQTGAWERNNAKNLGLFWLAGRYIICKTGDKQLRQIEPLIKTNGVYHGWSIGWGVEINNLVNIKVIYYSYVKKPEIAYSMPIYQFSFNYSLR
jgi:hypothetical protein